MVSGKSVPGYPSLVVGLMTIGGVQLIMIGIVGEYIGKILSELKARPIYFVAEHSEKHADVATDTVAGERTAAESMPTRPGSRSPPTITASLPPPPPPP